MRRDLRVVASPPARTERRPWRGQDGRVAVGPAVEVEVVPGQRPQFLGAGAGEQRHQSEVPIVEPPAWSTRAPAC